MMYSALIISTWPVNWYIVRPQFAPREDDFRRIIFKINDIIYTKWDDEFKAAWMWEKLKND